MLKCFEWTSEAIAAVTFVVSEPLDCWECQELLRKPNLLQNLAVKSRKT